MLKQLEIRHFAIIDHHKLDFQPGLTVITGETGAGKSILIDAVSLLLGDRASQDMIRSGADKATVSGCFEFFNDQIPSLLRQWNISLRKNELFISREITIQNKNTIRINDQLVSLQQLKSLAMLFADIHSQFDTQRLINPQTYLALLDGFQSELIGSYLSPYQQQLERYRASYHLYQTLVKEKEKLIAEKDRLTHQFQELDQSHLDPDEKDRLESDAKIMENYDKVYEHLNQVKNLFSEGHLLEHLYQIRTHLESIQSYSSEYQILSERVSDHYYELDDIRASIDDECQKLNFDPAVLDQIHERLYALMRLEEKYQRPIAELCALRDELAQLLEKAESVDDDINQAKQVVDADFQATLKSGQALSRVRKEIASRIETELVQLLKELALENIQFSIRLTSMDPKAVTDAACFADDGIDQIDFFISPNVGEVLKPLSKTASGGEMGRIMLGLKTLFIRQQHLSTMIFDEIDTGISGQVARQIGRKLQDIALSCQVLSITHIPQVVAKGHQHLHVEKVEVEGRTIALAKYCDFEERVLEIARMISGVNPSPSAIESAKELLLNP
ncbi:MAG: DNA repair protein RecN [Candidatus Izemoplasmatales bacterium]